MEEQTTKNKELAVKFWKTVWKERNLELFSEMIADDISYHSPRANLTGKEQYLELVKGYMDSVGESDIHIDDQIAEGDKVFCNVTFSGVHTGAFGEIPATHNKIKMQLMNVIQFKDGKVINEWEIFDELGMMLQLDMELVHKEHAH